MILKTMNKTLEGNNPHGSFYSTEIKQFAMTLHYHIPKACDIVKKIIKLPHSATICTWAASVDYEPCRSTCRKENLDKGYCVDSWCYVFAHCLCASRQMLYICVMYNNARCQ